MTDEEESSERLRDPVHVTLITCCVFTDNSPQMEGGEVVSNMEKAVTVSAQNTGF